ncbi:hypothetical protein GCM10009740_37080 [Terrabacter terrae]|uniref:Uncharacterized protein n=1 Tax=Terrabacter terrae TaxID=318434 RepID=A0ABN2UQ01_9MICO
MKAGPLLLSAFALALGTYQLVRRKAIAARADLVTRGAMSKTIAMRMSWAIGSLLLVLGLAGLVWTAAK